MDELRPELPERSKKAQVPYCVCLAWSADGSTLYSGEALKSVICPFRLTVPCAEFWFVLVHCAMLSLQRLGWSAPCSAEASAAHPAAGCLCGWGGVSGTQAESPCSSPQLCSTSIPDPAGYTDGAIRVWQVGRAI